MNSSESKKDWGFTKPIRQEEIEFHPANKIHKKEATQAVKVIRAFGGVEQLCGCLREQGYNIHQSTIYRWTYPKGKSSGTGGIIPSKWINRIVEIAIYYGVYLSEKDLDPRMKHKWMK